MREVMLAKLNGALEIYLAVVQHEGCVVRVPELNRTDGRYLTNTDHDDRWNGRNANGFEPRYGYVDINGWTRAWHRPTGVDHEVFAAEVTDLRAFIEAAPRLED